MHTRPSSGVANFADRFPLWKRGTKGDLRSLSIRKLKIPLGPLASLSPFTAARVYIPALKRQGFTRKSEKGGSLSENV